MKGISFRVIRPKPVKRGAITDVWITQANKIGILMAKDYSDITKNWGSGGLQFKYKVTGRDKIVITVQALNPTSKAAERWGYLDKGTKSHIIRPKNPNGVLAFPSWYKSGSRPNSLFVGASSSGGPTIFAKKVKVKGIKPRNWSILMRKKWEIQMPKEAAYISTMLAKASGHQI